MLFQNNIMSTAIKKEMRLTIQQPKKKGNKLGLSLVSIDNVNF